jgi:predicted DCC family thiol-disulfide oxidoreductase YuxK
MLADGSSLARPAIHRTRAQSRLILFDGVCNLCNAWVRFVVRHDPAGVFRFAAQQSPVGQAIIRQRINGPWQLSSVILIVDDSIYTDSTAVLEILTRLTAPWSWASVLRVLPRRLLDCCYRFIVSHRYQWFGRTDTCQMPSVELRSRFIDEHAIVTKYGR